MSCASMRFALTSIGLSLRFLLARRVCLPTQPATHSQVHGHRHILDNGLIFQSRRFRAAFRDYRLLQEFITPYTPPEQNGLGERFFRSLKEECVWLHNFDSFTEARTAINKWIQWYNAGRPHQSLGYRSPRQFRALHPPPL